MSSQHDSLPDLTETERRCLERAANGRTPAEIAHETGLRAAQATEALHSAVDKLGARNVLGAISRAARLGLI